MPASDFVPLRAFCLLGFLFRRALTADWQQHFFLTGCGLTWPLKCVHDRSVITTVSLLIASKPYKTPSTTTRNLRPATANIFGTGRWVSGDSQHGHAPINQYKHDPRNNDHHDSRQCEPPNSEAISPTARRPIAPTTWRNVAGVVHLNSIQRTEP